MLHQRASEAFSVCRRVDEQAADMVVEEPDEALDRTILDQPIVGAGKVGVPHGTRLVLEDFLAQERVAQAGRVKPDLEHRPMVGGNGPSYVHAFPLACAPIAQMSSNIRSQGWLTGASGLRNPSRPWGAAKSGPGPTGTIPVGFMWRWLS